MNGYVRNISRVWKHAMKRSVAPNQKIDLDVLHEEYGQRHDIPEGREFVEWLRNVKLKDTGSWEIVYKEDWEAKENGQEEVNDKTVEKDEAEELVEMSVRQAKERLKNVISPIVLRRALEIARVRPQKETMTIMLRKRLKEIESFSSTGR